jgi:hypothetical protein
LNDIFMLARKWLMFGYAQTSPRTMNMNTDDQIFLRRVPLFTVGVLTLCLAACDPKPVLDERDRSSGLRVEEGSDAVANGADKAGQRVGDLALNIKVEDALKENLKLKSLEVKVHSAGGIVILSGTSDTDENSKLATQIVMNVSGVKSVQNKLVVVDG